MNDYCKNFTIKINGKNFWRKKKHSKWQTTQWKSWFLCKLWWIGIILLFNPSIFLKKRRAYLISYFQDLYSLFEIFNRSGIFHLSSIKKWIGAMYVIFCIDSYKFSTIYKFCCCPSSTFIAIVFNASPVCNILNITIFSISMWRME